MNRLATNLHTHGLRVSPEGNSDNPFLRIEPGETFDYLFRIPSDHPAGTYWYHPHHHGTVADQIFAGLVGALLVDRHPEIPVEADRVFLVTDTTLTENGEVAEVSGMERAMGRQGALVLVNGQHQPTIPATVGATQRWRIINGCTSRVLPVRLAGHELVQVAQDGTFLPAPTSRDRVVLAPGNRADVIVRPTGPGRYPVTADAVDRGAMGGMGGDATSGPVTLATLEASGTAASPPPLPATLTAETPPTAPVTRRREIAFQMGMGMGWVAWRSSTIDGREFDPNRDDQIVPLGATEEWTVTNLRWRTRSTCTSGRSSSPLPATTAGRPELCRTWCSSPPADQLRRNGLAYPRCPPYDGLAPDGLRTVADVLPAARLPVRSNTSSASATVANTSAHCETVRAEHRRQEADERSDLARRPFPAMPIARGRGGERDVRGPS